MNTEQETKTFNVLKYGLSRYLPIRIILRKVDNGELHGLCEDSFSIGTSGSFVRIWWSGKAYSILGEHNVSGIDDAKDNAKQGDLILDPLSDDCPVEIDWDRWLKSTTKYYKRNAPFGFKEALK